MGEVMFASHTSVQTSGNMPDADAPLFTIFTPTYNRAHTLHRAFESLSAQTLRSFEWLVVDDGSTDGTEQLIAAWAKVADFPVRYIRQDHAGKHFAHNRALTAARGYFITSLDSDDALVPNALERLAYHWNTIPESERGIIYAVFGLCCDQKGNVVGDRYPSEPFDVDGRDLTYVHRIRGEKWGVSLTDVLRRYPFPETARGQYLPEGLVALDIAKTFKKRHVNEVFRIYYIDDAEPGVTVAKKRNLSAHAIGFWHYYIWLINNDLEYFFRSPKPFLKAAVMLPIVARSSGQTLRNTFSALRDWQAKLLVLSALPFALLLYVYDKVRSKLR
jgi:glycosyltransferase involved in cell wall biosynthesis